MSNEEWEIVTDPEAAIEHDWQCRIRDAPFPFESVSEISIGRRCGDFWAHRFRRPVRRDSTKAIAPDGDIASQLAAVTADRGRWLARCLRLEMRLARVEAALDHRKETE